MICVALLTACQENVKQKDNLKPLTHTQNRTVGILYDQNSEEPPSESDSLVLCLLFCFIKRVKVLESSSCFLQFQPGNMRHVALSDLQL